MVALPDVDVSIIIVSCNERDFLRSCLASIYERTHDIEFEVIVVDNASQDGAPEMVGAEFPQTRLVRRKDNGGFAKAVNEGISAARGEAFFIFNPDAEVLDNGLPRMLAYLREQPDIGILAPRLLNQDGTLQLSCRAFPSFGTAFFNRYSLLSRIFPDNRYSRRYLMRDFDHDRTADVDWVSGACWLLPRAVYEKIGPLDDGYFWSIEDVDYCQRLHRAGLRVVYYPEVTVSHFIGGSAATHRSRTIIERHRGMWRYYRTYLRPGGIARLLVDSVVGFGIATRCGAQLAIHDVRNLIRRGAS